MVKSCCLLWQNSMSELMVGENLLSTLKIFNVLSGEPLDGHGTLLDLKAFGEFPWVLCVGGQSHQKQDCGTQDWQEANQDSGVQNVEVETARVNFERAGGLGTGSHAI